MLRAADRELAKAIRVVAGLYGDGVLPRPAGTAAPWPDLLAIPRTPSPIERRLYEMYLVHRGRSFQGTFHSSPGHALWEGWAGLVRDREDIERMAAELRSRARP